MPVPKGFHGKKGRSGRKAAWEEKKDFLWHDEIWQKAQEIGELENKIASGTYSGRDMAAFMLLKGNARIIGKFMDKLIPDLSRLVDENGKDILSVDELAQRIANIRAKKK